MVYKETVCLMPLDDFDKNMTLVGLERRINGITNMIADHLD